MNLRDHLAKKRAHSTSLSFPLGEEGEAAKAALEDAETSYALMGLSTNEEGLAAAQKRRDEAREKYRAVSFEIRFRGLTENERDALSSEHTYAEDDLAANVKSGDLNVKTYLPAALAVCVVDSTLTEAEWAAELSSDRWTAGEKDAMFSAVVTATRSQPAAGIPKG